MSIRTAIGWCDSTVNPTMGCDGCELWCDSEKTCYAGVLHERYGGTNSGFSRRFDVLSFYPGRMSQAAAWSDLTGTERPDKPWLNNLPRHIFISDMSDALSRSVTFEYLKQEIIDVVSSAKGRRHVWMWLTKQSARMEKFSEWLKDLGVEWPSNLMPGTSITTQPTAARLKHLLNVGVMLSGGIDNRVRRFVSVEPIRGPITLRGFHLGWYRCPQCDSAEDPSAEQPLGISRYCGACDRDEPIPVDGHHLHLVIVGGDSGSGRRGCKLEWITNLADECKLAQIPFFVKQDAGPRPGMQGRISDEIWEIKQMPKVA